MSEEMISRIMASTPASAESKKEGHLTDSLGILDVNGVPSDLKRKERPVPNYLRASTGSCHDNCKFGVQRSPESRKYWPVRQWRKNSMNAGNAKQDRVGIVPQMGRPRNKDKKVEICHVKLKDDGPPAKPESTKLKLPKERVSDQSECSPCAEEQSAEASEPVLSETLPADANYHISSHDYLQNCGDGGSSEGAVSIELEMPLAIQDSDASEDHVSDVILPSEGVHKAGEQSPVNHVSDQSANECASLKKRTDQNVMTPEKHEQHDHAAKSESLSKESVNLKAKPTIAMTRNAALRQQRRVRTSHQKASGMTVVNCNGAKTMRKKADASAATKLNSEKKYRSTATPAVPKFKEIKVSSPSNAIDSSGQPATLSKLKAAAKDVPSLSLPSGKQTDRKMTVKDAAMTTQYWQKKGEGKVIPCPPKLSHINMSDRSLSSIKMRVARKEKFDSPKNSNEKVYRAANVAVDLLKGKLKMASPKVQKLDVNNKPSRSQKEKPATPRTEAARTPKSASISSSTMTPSPRKLTFRRGKVLSLHGSESSTPRRLRFRPAKTADDSGRGCREASRGGRITRKAHAAVSGDAGSASARAEVVVLRHLQDVRDRKSEEQGLLNSVIKETASKLVEARKSKVKALVGAFETVISLQEGKPAAAELALSWPLNS